MLFCASPVFALDVPSGQPVTLSEVLVDEVGAELWMRFRFLAPDIARDAAAVTYADAEGDFQALCDDFALSYIASFGFSADVVVISLMDRPVAFGAADPEATQFFEAFRPSPDGCVWEEL
ncbi:hypothetical protein RA29_02425 [Tateyamaria sp. ANG-S1]|nr:hypothetical protein RA29_02425 [Tateyamaria sp. ANG-S1]